MASLFTHDYLERVYAGVLGKMIGVYLGRPFEGWTYERIMEHLGEIRYYVHEKLHMPLIVTDDDLSGTFTFLRAIEDNQYDPGLTAEQIGKAWLNYIIEERTILWWGGLGNSTEHTAYLRLKQGIPAPRSGSLALNGKVVAEQIGAQIFIDGWAMVAPGDPDRAADLARRAASVSHDGEAIYGAQVLAAIEALAFIEPDLNKLLDAGISYIPRDSIIYRLIQDIRAWHSGDKDWRKTRERIVEQYGYAKFGGGCHMVPNHALIILALLYGNDDFQQSLLIANTSGWDTDCNSGNVGCLLGIKNGLRGLEGGPDWRGPVADRLYLPTADGGRAITDAVQETYRIARAAYALAGSTFTAPKQGARFNFALPGSVQGFQPVDASTNAHIANVAGQSELGSRSLAIAYETQDAEQVVRVATATFVPPEAITMGGYSLMASPTLHTGQIVHAYLRADQANSTAVSAQLFVQYYGADDQLLPLDGAALQLAPGQDGELQWRVPETEGAPIATIGIALRAPEATSGKLYLDALTWQGAPAVTLGHPQNSGKMWLRAWVNSMDHFEAGWPETYRLIQNHSRGLAIQGSRDWQDYRAETTLTPHLAKSFGLAVRTQGLRRYYALLLSNDQQARLVKMYDDEIVLAAVPFAWELYHPYQLTLQATGNTLQAWIDGTLLLTAQDEGAVLTGGAVALLCEEGRVGSSEVRVQPEQS